MENQPVVFDYFAGIDISKSYFDVTVLDTGEVKRGYKRFDNSQVGYEALLAWITSLNISIDKCLFCMEHTGIYGRSLRHFLQDSLCYLWMESGLEIHLSMGIKRGKNDKIDSKRIAEYAQLRRNKAKITEYYDSYQEQLHDLLSTRNRLVKAHGSLMTAQEEIKKFDLDSYLRVKECQQDAVDGLLKSIKYLEQTLDEYIEKQPDWQKNLDLSTTVKGLGKITVLWLMVYTHNFSEKYSPRQIASFSGVAPYEVGSGTSVNKGTHISDFAEKQLKKSLHMSAMCAIRYNPVMKEYYERKKKEGKKGLVILNNIRNKLIHQLIGIVRSGKPFDPEYHINRCAA